MQIINNFKPKISNLLIDKQTIIFQEQRVQFKDHDQLFELLENLDLNSSDGLDIQIAVFDKFQIDIKPEKGIDLAEQIKWHLANILSEQIENINYAYTIYRQNDQEIIGIGGYLTAEMVEQLKTTLEKRSVQILSICSPDKQFVFYTKSFNFLTSSYYLQKILKATAILLLIFLSITVATVIISQNSMEQRKNQITALREEIAQYEKILLVAKNSQIIFEQNKKIKKINNELFSGLLDIFNITPGWINYQELAVDNSNILLQIDCYQQEHHLNSYLKQLKKQKYIKDIILVRSDHLAGKITAELKLITRRSS